MAETTSQVGRDSLLAAGAEQELLNAITPDVILYTIDDDGYDTDRTVLMDPPDLFEQKSVNQFQNMAQDLRVEEKELVTVSQRKRTSATIQAISFLHRLRAEHRHSR